jgi:hypothetical protein
MTPTTPKRKALPIFKGKTVYRLLTFIKKLVNAEPKRINMCYVLMKGTGIQQVAADRLARNEHRAQLGLKLLRPLKTPACGTVGCIAGWSDVVTGFAQDDNIRNDGYYHEIGQRLGLTNGQIDELFMPNHLVSSQNHQTRRHANAVITHITKFQKKYRQQLTTTKVVFAEAN